MQFPLSKEGTRPNRHGEENQRTGVTGTAVTTIFANTERARGYAIQMCSDMPLPFIARIAKGGNRSIAQNNYLWGVCYATILETGQLEGWEADDLHEYFLGEHFGWDVLEGFGKKRMKPVQRSSSLSKLEFADYVAFIQRKAAGMGVVIPDPE